MRGVSRFATLVWGLVLFASLAAGAENRVALVIGNAAYEHATILRNPRNDAEAIGRLLGEIGFDVAVKIDLNYETLRQEVKDFGRKAINADMAIIYFAGHGLELDGENYLVPTDARLETDADLEYEAVTLTSMLHAVERARGLRVVILDACRNNPFGQRMVPTGTRTRSVARGLGQVEPTGDVIVAYSAKHGTLAQDGTGSLSPYAAALVEHMARPGIDIRLMLGSVRDSVRKATDGVQDPFYYGSLPGSLLALVPAASESTALQEAEIAEIERKAAELKAKRERAEAEAAEAERRRALAEERRKKEQQAAEEAERKRDEAEGRARTEKLAAEEAERQRKEAEERKKEEYAKLEEEAKRRESTESTTFALSVCNQDWEAVSIAVSHYSADDSGWVVEGWWTVPASGCEKIGRFRKGTFYVYAKVYSGIDWQWSGSYNLCVQSKLFRRLNSAGYTCGSHEFLAGFTEKSTQESEYTWTLNGRAGADLTDGVE